MIMTRLVSYGFLTMFILSLVYKDKWIFNFIQFYSIMITFGLIIIVLLIFVSKELINKFNEEQSEKYFKAVFKKKGFFKKAETYIVNTLFIFISIYHGFFFTAFFICSALILVKIFYPGVVSSHLEEKFGADFVKRLKGEMI